MAKQHISKLPNNSSLPRSVHNNNNYDNDDNNNHDDNHHDHRGDDDHRGHHDDRLVGATDTLRLVRRPGIALVVATGLLVAGCRQIGYTRTQVRDRWVHTYEAKLGLTRAEAARALDILPKTASAAVSRTVSGMSKDDLA